MSMMDMDPDEEFMKIMEGIELEEPTDAIDYTQLTDIELAKEYDRIRTTLFKMDELLNLNATGEAAALHSQFAAVNDALRRRHRPI